MDVQHVVVENNCLRLSKPCQTFSPEDKTCGTVMMKTHETGIYLPYILNQQLGWTGIFPQIPESHAISRVEHIADRVSKCVTADLIPGT